MATTYIRPAERVRRESARTSRFGATRMRVARTPTRPGGSVTLTLLCALVLVYSLVPLVWLLINATKSQSDLFSSFGLWFGDGFSLWSNIKDTVTYDDAIFVRWLGNTLLYVVAGAGGATFLSVLGGYAIAKFSFMGRRTVIAVVIGAVAVPGTHWRSPRS